MAVFYGMTASTTEDIAILYSGGTAVQLCTILTLLLTIDLFAAKYSACFPLFVTIITTVSIPFLTSRLLSAYLSSKIHPGIIIAIVLLSETSGPTLHETVRYFKPLPQCGNPTIYPTFGALTPPADKLTPLMGKTEVYRIC